MQTHVFCMNVTPLRDNRLFEAAMQRVHIQRREKLMQLHQHMDKCRSLGAALVLDKGLERLGLNIHAPALAYGHKGKPILRDYPQLHISLSHSGDYAVAAISDMPVGCDVEQTGPFRLAVAKRFFTPAEYGWLTAQPDMQTGFYRLWTLKESFLKVTGQGLSLPLHDFSVIMDKTEISVEQSISAPKFYFREYELQAGYALAVCGENPCFAQQVTKLEADFP